MTKEEDILLDKIAQQTARTLEVVEDIQENAATKKDLKDVADDVQQITDDLRNFRNATKENFTQVHQDLKELKSSARVLDRWLEEHLLERVQRLERAQNLPPYAHHQADNGE
ncbi:MAG: hypothetical protein AAB691_00095 [Patescibacteria group bacterium]